MISSVREILKSFKIAKEGVKGFDLWKNWEDIVGEQVARNCVPEKFQGGQLLLKVSSPVWMNQLQLLKPVLLEKINSRVGKDSPVADIRFKVGVVSAGRRKEQGSWREIGLPKEQVSRIEAEMASVEDLQLRQILKDLRIKGAKLKIWRDQKSGADPSTTSPR